MATECETTENREYHRIRIDDTPMWDAEFLTKHRITKMETAYVFDKNSVTHCCELTPSYEMHPSGYEVAFRDDVLDSDKEDGWEALEDSGSFVLEEIKYFHCRSIAGIELESLGEWESLKDALEWSMANGG